MTELKPDKQALAVTLCLPIKARDTSLEIDAKDLNKDDGMTKLLTKMDSVFKKKTVDEASETCHAFEKFKRSNEDTISDYIVRFEHLCSKAKNIDMTLPETVSAYKLLEGANLSQQKRQLALTATNKLEYLGMKSALKHIFGEKFTGTASSSVVKVKEEPM